MSLIDEPLLTSVITRDDLLLNHDSTYIFGTGVEDRSVIESSWRDRMEALGVHFIVADDSADVITMTDSTGRTLEFTGRQRSMVAEYLGSARHIYLDITGMSYVAWAPLVRAVIEHALPLTVVYVEPIDYRRSKIPTRGMLFDLSEGFDGLRPIPGFAALNSQMSSEWHLVAALGFEGARFSHVINELEPASGHVVPVIGVPGFRPEFITQALIANRADLDDSSVASKIRFARANCPFDMFQTLHSIHVDVGGAPLRVAPIGTKPHGLGTVLFSMSRPTQVQLVYDHPRRKAKRTLGTSRVCVYEVSMFCESDLFSGPSL